MNVVHQHGTILREADPSPMFRVLKVPNGRIRDKLIKSVEERVTSINKQLGKEVRFEELKESLIKGFEGSFGIKLAPGKTLELEEEKYATKEWNFKR